MMGRELTMGVSSTRMVQKQQNIFGRISLFWNVALQGHPVQQSGGVHDWLIQGSIMSKWLKIDLYSL